MADSPHTNDTPRYKVGKVIKRYSLDGMGEDLEARWIGDDVDSDSLRELAEYFNKELLRKTLTESERQQFSGEIETIYRLLTGDKISRGEQTRIRKVLERDGVDVEQLERDFVTHQAIHTYLTKGREIKKEDETGDRLESAHQTINRLRSRLIAVTETSLSNLQEVGLLTLGSFDVFVEMRVHCTDCGMHKNISELFADGGCECDDER